MHGKAFITDVEEKNMWSDESEELLKTSIADFKEGFLGK